MWSYKDLLRSFAKNLLNQFKLSDASVSLGVVDFAPLTLNLTIPLHNHNPYPDPNPNSKTYTQVDFASQATVVSRLSTDAAAVSSLGLGLSLEGSGWVRLVVARPSLAQP